MLRWALIGSMVLGCAGPVPVKQASEETEVGEAKPQKTAPRPNVLIISLDTTRPDHLGLYGYHRETSPALDAFAAQGVVFDRAYAPSPSTVPSHATLFTGLLPSQHRTVSYREELVDRAATLSEHFKAVGYRTFAVSSSVRFPPESGFHQGFDHWLQLEDLPKNERSEAVSDAALERMAPSSLADSVDRAPFFGFLHYFGPHEPYAPPEPFRSRWHPGLDFPRPEATSEYLQAHSRPEHQVPAEILEYLVALYDGEILFLDQQLDRLFHGLESFGLAENTLVVVASDHGDGFRENGRLSHNGDLNEELLRIPLIFRWPSRLAPGRSDLGVGLVDVLPTLLDLLDLPGAARTAGRSFAHVLLRRPAVAEDPGLVIGQLGARWSISAETDQGRFRLERRENGSERLYDLDEDRWGSRDVLEQHGEVADELRTLAGSYFSGPGHEQFGDLFSSSEGEPTPIEVDPEMLERLRAIGYVDEVDGDPSGPGT